VTEYGVSRRRNSTVTVEQFRKKFRHTRLVPHLIEVVAYDSEGSVRTRHAGAYLRKGFGMSTVTHSMSPTILLRITDGSVHMHRSFNDFAQAQKSAEAFAGAGFNVAMISATGRFLMGFDPPAKRVAG
jgi:hypothetical protein